MRSTATAWSGPRWVLCVPGAVPVLAFVLRRPHVAVSIPVTEAVWSRWRRRVAWSQGAVAFGAVLIAVGSIVRAAAPLVGGVVVLLGTVALWARANRNWWITCVLDLSRDVVIIEPTHREFDEAAREMFVRSIQ